jgi:hypothetical protein
MSVGLLTRRVALLGCALLLFGAGTAAVKFHRLAIGSYPPGSRVAITNSEFNVYLATEIPLIIGPGVRSARVETDTGNIVRGFADIDFLTVRQAYGEKPNWVMSQLLSGERPVEITVRITSGNGMCRVDVLRVAVSGVIAEGRTLELLINNFVIPSFPDVKIGKDFPMDFNVDRLEIRPGVVYVALRAAQPR